MGRQRVVETRLPGRHVVLDTRVALDDLLRHGAAGAVQEVEQLPVAPGHHLHPAVLAGDVVEGDPERDGMRPLAGRRALLRPREAGVCGVGILVEGDRGARVRALPEELQAERHELAAADRREQIREALVQQDSQKGLRRLVGPVASQVQLLSLAGAGQARVEGRAQPPEVLRGEELPEDVEAVALEAGSTLAAASSPSARGLSPSPPATARPRGAMGPVRTGPNGAAGRTP